MKKIKYFLMMATMVMISSCGGSSESKSEQNAENAESVEVVKVTPETTTVKGSLNGCFEVIDREYKLTDDWGTKIKVALKRTNVALPFNVADVVDIYSASESSKPNVFGIGVEFIDADGEIVATADPYSESKDFLLFSLNADETATIECRATDDDNIRTAVKFRVTSIVKENEYKDEQKAEASSETTNDYSSDDDIDEDLKDLDKAVKATKKAAEAAGALYDVAKSLEDL